MPAVPADGDGVPEDEKGADRADEDGEEGEEGHGDVLSVRVCAVIDVR